MLQRVWLVYCSRMANDGSGVVVTAIPFMTQHSAEAFAARVADSEVCVGEPVVEECKIQTDGDHIVIEDVVAC